MSELLSGICAISPLFAMLFYFFVYKERYPHGWTKEVNPAADAQKVGDEVADYLRGTDRTEPRRYFSGHAPSVEQQRNEEKKRRHVVESMRRMKGEDKS